METHTVQLNANVKKDTGRRPTLFGKKSVITKKKEHSG